MQNIKSVDYIVTAKHYGGSGRGYIRKMQQQLHRERGIAVTIKDLDQEPTGAPVMARIWQGQWIADCCNAGCFVDPNEPIFFCFQCGNRSNGSKPRPVIFPPEAERKEIERLLLERPVDDYVGLTDLERAGMAKALLAKEVEEEPGKRVLTLPLTRSWEPHETVDDLRKQQEEPIGKWRKELREGKHGIQ